MLGMLAKKRPDYIKAADTIAGSKAVKSWNYKLDKIIIIYVE